MARINTIENDLILDLADKLAGSRSEDGRTRNYPLSSIASLLARTGSANTLGVTLAWKPAVDRTDIMDGEYIVTQDELLNLTSVTVSATTLNGVQVLEILQEFVGGEVKITAAKDSGYRFFAIDSPQTLVTTADGTITIAITDLGRGQNNVTLNESNLGITSLGARGARGHSISNITSSKVGTTTTITIIYADGTQQETFELEDGIDGDSAYEVWLAEGNTGSTMDFLTSLVGAQGFQGKYFESIYTSSTSNPGIPAPSTDYDIDAGTFTPPTTWSSAVPNRGSDESIYEARANVDPAGISTTLVWMSPIGYSGVGMVASEGYFTTLATAAGLGETDPDAERQVITTNEVYNDLRAAAALDPTLLATLQRVTFDIIDDPRASATSSLTGNLDITGEYRRNGVAISAAVGFGSDGGEVATWAEGDDTTTIPTTKIPNLSTSKITGLSDSFVTINTDQTIDSDKTLTGDLTVNGDVTLGTSSVVLDAFLQTIEDAGGRQTIVLAESLTFPNLVETGVEGNTIRIARDGENLVSGQWNNIVSLQRGLFLPSLPLISISQGFHLIYIDSSNWALVETGYTQGPSVGGVLTNHYITNIAATLGSFTVGQTAFIYSNAGSIDVNDFINFFVRNTPVDELVSWGTLGRTSGSNTIVAAVVSDADDQDDVPIVPQLYWANSPGQYTEGDIVRIRLWPTGVSQTTTPTLDLRKQIIEVVKNAQPSSTTTTYGGVGTSEISRVIITETGVTTVDTIDVETGGVPFPALSNILYLESNQIRIDRSSQIQAVRLANPANIVLDGRVDTTELEVEAQVLLRGLSSVDPNIPDKLWQSGNRVVLSGFVEPTVTATTLTSLGITSTAAELNNLLSISSVSEEAIPLKRSNALVNSGIVLTPGVTSTTDRVGTGANLLSIPVSLITFGGTSFAILASAVSTLTQGQVYEFRDSSDASVAGIYTLTSVLGGLATFTYVSGSNTSALLAIGAGGILETRATVFSSTPSAISIGTSADALNLAVTGTLTASGLPTSFAPANAEQNVQPDYTATTGDARILNKPTLGNLAAQDLADIAVATTQVTGLTAFVDGRITAIGDIETYADEAAFTAAIALGTTIWNKGDVAILASPSSAYLFTGTDGATTGVTLANDFSIISSAASLASLGITVSATEINLLDGASSNIQDQLDLTNPSTRGAVFPSSPSFGDEFYLNDTIVGVVPYGTAVFFENYANAGGTAAGAVFITQSAANYNVQISAERDAVVPALGVDSAPVTVYSRVDSSSPWVLLGPTIDSAINGSQNRIRFSTNLAIALLNAIQPGYELGYQSTSTPEGWYKFVDNAWTAISPGGTSALPVTVAMTTNLADGSIPFNSSGSLEDSGLDVTLGTTSTTEREGTGNAIAIIQPADITPTTGTTFDTTSTVTAVLGVGSFYEFGSNNIYEYTSTTFGTATFTRVSGTTPFGLSVMVGGINIRATAFVANKGVLAIGSTTGSNSDRLDIELSGDITNGLTIGKSDGITNINGSESLIFKGLNDIENGQIQIIGGSNSALQIFTGSVGVLTSAMVVQVNNTAIPGNLNLSDTGGIRFGTTSTTTATGSASTSKTLDDYEEGTWTATGPQSSTTTTGIYTKIGNQVTLQARISGLDYGASTGTTFTAAVSGLPFAPVASTLGIARLSNSVGTEIDTDIIRVIRLANIISLTSIQGGSGIEAIDLIITYTTTA